MNFYNTYSSTIDAVNLQITPSQKKRIRAHFDTYDAQGNPSTLTQIGIPVTSEVLDLDCDSFPSLNTIDCIFKVESVVQPEIYSVSEFSIKITEKALIVIENKLNNQIYSALDSIDLIWQSYNL